jgi:hypothetical protein
VEIPLSLFFALDIFTNAYPFILIYSDSYYTERRRGSLSDPISHVFLCSSPKLEIFPKVVAGHGGSSGEFGSIFKITPAMTSASNVLLPAPILGARISPVSSLAPA